MENQASVLIIDDDYELASVLQTILRNKGYKTLVAHSAAQVASLLAQNTPHASWPVSLILLDLMMPQIDGSELYGWLRAHPKTADTPIVVLSAVDSISKRVELLSKGADDYIVKPCPVEELLARVSIHIKLHELRQARQAAEVRSDLQANFLNAIDTMGQQIQHAGDDLDVMLNKAAQAIVEYFGHVNCAIYLSGSSEGEQLELVGRYPAEFTPPTSYLPFLKRVTLQRESISSGLTVGVPLMHHDRLLGVLVTQMQDVHKQQEELRQALRVIARQIALAVANSYLSAEVQKKTTQFPPAVTTAEEVLELNKNHYDPLQTVYSYLQLLTEFDMARDKQIDYLKLASEEIVTLLGNAGEDKSL